MPIWPLPFVAGLLPAAGTLVALWLSIHLDLIPACIPLLDGCVSISRVAREGLPNHVFKAAMLPAATLQGITWLAVAHSLKPLVPEHARGLAWLPVLGAIAAVALIAYGTFLGTDGTTYRWLRTNGIVFYFGMTALCMITVSGAIQTAVRQGKLTTHWPLDRTLLPLVGILAALGLITAIGGPIAGEPFKNRIENICEWWAALIFSWVFMVLAALAYQNKITWAVHLGPPPDDPRSGS